MLSIKPFVGPFVVPLGLVHRLLQPPHSRFVCGDSLRLVTECKANVAVCGGANPMRSADAAAVANACWLARMASIRSLCFWAVIASALGSSLSASTPSTVLDKDTSLQSYYANAHPYLGEQWENLFKLIPELKGLQRSQDQVALPMILQMTGQQVDAFTTNIVDLIAREKVVQEARNWRSDLLGSQLVVDNYLVLTRNNGFITRMKESRLDLNGNPVKRRRGSEPGEGVFSPGFRVSSGFTSSTAYFATSQQPSSTFRYLGTERIGDRDTYVVAFAQLPSEATITTRWVDWEGDQVQMLVQGIAWVDMNSFQILRLRTDLLAPRPDIRLVRVTTKTTFSEVHIPSVPGALWFPSSVNEYFEQTDPQMRVLRFSNTYSFTDYHRYLGNETQDSNRLVLDVSPRIYYGNARPYYLDEPSEYLVKLIPELKQLQPEANQQVLPLLLEKTGLQVDSFFRNTPNLIADEDVRQQELSSTGDVKLAHETRDEYLILFKGNRNEAHLDEYRMDAKGNRVEPLSTDRHHFRSAFFVTSGFAFSCVYFSTAVQSEATFRYLGEQRIGTQNTYVVAFAQRPDATTTVTMRGSGGVNVHMLVQGIAWVDKDDFQIIKIRTDLLAPRLEIGLDRQTTEVTLSQVRFRDIASPLWLPKVVRVYFRFYGQNFKNEHHYGNYRRYRVSSKMIVPP